MRNYKKYSGTIILSILLIASFFSISMGFTNPPNTSPPLGKIITTSNDSLVIPNVQFRVQRMGNINMCQTNWGNMGSRGRQMNESLGGCFNPQPDSEVPAPSFEFPKDSGLEYLFSGAIWFGAKINDFPYVSVGWDGFDWVYEMWPDGPAPLGSIEEYSKNPESSCYSPFAISDHDITTRYSDTLLIKSICWCGPFWDYVDMRWHRPLGVEIVQKNYSWLEQGLQDIIISEYSIKNIGEEILEDVYVGLFLDTDICEYVYPYFSQDYMDDITGFLKKFEIAPGDTEEVNIAWAADIDGWAECDGGVQWIVRDIIGTKILGVSPSNVQFSYNWWISCPFGLPNDWGPWTIENQTKWAQENCYTPGDTLFPHDALGTPGGDCSKYFIMSNGETDYDQVYSCTWPLDHPEEGWLNPSEICTTFADGNDTRFLLSFGPFEEFMPGDSISFAVAYIMGENFHTDPDNGQNLPANPDSFYAHVDFSDLVNKALLAQRTYDTLLYGPTHVEESQQATPPDFSLSQNYPNPFNPETRFEYVIPAGREQSSHTVLQIFNILGQSVKTLVDEPQAAGRYQVVWDGKDESGDEVASGIYFYKLKIGEHSQTKRMVLIR